MNFPSDRVPVYYLLFHPTTLWTKGGGEVQALMTFRAMKKAGWPARLMDIWAPPSPPFILHLIGSTHHLADITVAARQAGGRVVVSTVLYHGKSAWKWVLWSRVDPLVPVKTEYGIRRRLLHSADMLIAASQVEAEELQRVYQVDPARIRVVHLGVPREVASVSQRTFIERFGVEGFVLQVGRISWYKGQERLIKAVEKLGLPLVLIGSPDPSDPAGVRRVMELIKQKNWITYIPGLPFGSTLLWSAYAAARVHVLPSVNETTGLATLEAAAAGCEVVQGYSEVMKEYLGDFVTFCDPLSVQSIAAAIEQALRKPKQPELSRFVLDTYSWDSVGQKLAELYSEVITTGE